MTWIWKRHERMYAPSESMYIYSFNQKTLTENLSHAKGPWGNVLQHGLERTENSKKITFCGRNNKVGCWIWKVLVWNENEQIG